MSSFEPTPKRLLAGISALLIIILYAGLYVFGALRQLREVNTSPGLVDQSAYMLFARKLYKFEFHYSGDRNRMPVYPFFQALFFHPGEQRKVFFENGKYRNMVLSVFLLAGIALIFRRHFSSLHTLDLMLIVGFTVFIFKAGWFQAELLFYFLSFALFYLMWRLLKKPSFAAAILIGLLAGVAHLTKASILPGLVVFLTVLASEQGLYFYRKLSRGEVHFPALHASSDLLIVPLITITFVISVYPYIRESKIKYGSYFYNVNSTFYMWYESWEEASQGTKAHGDREGWPDMPPEDIPSPGKYFREHTPSQILHRIVDGAGTVLTNVYHSYGYLKYIVYYFGLLVSGAILYRKRAVELLRSNKVVFIFLCLYFSCYILLYAWYAPIADGNRFILAQFLPLLFVISLGVQVLLKDVTVSILNRENSLLTIFNWVILTILLVDIYFILTDLVVSIMGGT